jgi:hypothetical protein
LANAKGLMVVLRGGGGSYERGTPVPRGQPPCAAENHNYYSAPVRSGDNLICCLICVG